jgi:hypothetical protein
MSYQIFHEKLHSLREGIGGSDWKRPEFLSQRVKELVGLAEKCSPIDVKPLKELQKQLLTLIETESTYDVHKRIEIDELACKILNDQEKRLRR